MTTTSPVGQFLNAFSSAVKGSPGPDGRLAVDAVHALSEAAARIDVVREPLARAAAEQILSRFRSDREIDTFDLKALEQATRALAQAAPRPRSTVKLEQQLQKWAAPQTNVRVRRYDLTFDVRDPRAASFQATARLTLERKAPVGHAAILEVDPDRLSVTSVLADGKPVPFEVAKARLFVTAPGAKSLEVTYSVRPTEDAHGYGLIRTRSDNARDLKLWTLTWPYHTGALFPSVSNPEDGASAQVQLLTHARTAVATDSDHPMPAYAIAFKTAEDLITTSGGEAKDGVAISVLTEETVAPHIRRAAADTARDAEDFYSALYGAPYDYGKTLSVVQEDFSLGGMEHAGIVALGTGVFKKQRDAVAVVAHEVGHHWTGNNQRIAGWDLQMSEAFTEYSTFRYLRHAYGENRYREALAGSKLRAERSLTRHNHPLTPAPGTDVLEVFDSIPYHFGAWMLRMLEVKLGTETFDQLRRDWYAASKGKAVSTKDWTDFASEHSGVDVTAFYAAWNALREVPRLSVGVHKSERQVTLDVLGLTPFPPDLRIPVKISGKDGRSKWVTLNPNVSGADTFPVPFRPTKVEFDPDQTVFAFVQPKH